MELLTSSALSVAGSEMAMCNNEDLNHVRELLRLIANTCTHAISLMKAKQEHMQRLRQMWMCEKDAKEVSLVPNIPRMYSRVKKVFMNSTLIRTTLIQHS